jgi:hypothetical protein
LVEIYLAEITKEERRKGGKEEKYEKVLSALAEGVDKNSSEPNHSLFCPDF